jgi:hypothetical protein
MIIRLRICKYLRNKNPLKFFLIADDLIIIFSQKRGLIFCVLGLLSFAIAIGVTVGTASVASQKAGLYVLYVGKSTFEKNLFAEKKLWKLK